MTPCLMTLVVFFSVCVKVSEDCLYLNVFVPLDVDFRSPLQRPLPVLLWVHGGDFIAGSASKPLYDGRFVSNLTHTVVVSVEYRLGEDARNRFTPKSGLEVFTGVGGGPWTSQSGSGPWAVDCGL